MKIVNEDTEKVILWVGYFKWTTRDCLKMSQEPFFPLVSLLIGGIILILTGHFGPQLVRMKYSNIYSSIFWETHPINIFSSNTWLRTKWYPCPYPTHLESTVRRDEGRLTFHPIGSYGGGLSSWYIHGDYLWKCCLTDLKWDCI